MKRFKMGRQQSRRDFTRKAIKHHGINTRGRPMRGGIRL